MEATINLERHVDDHRRVDLSQGQVHYSDVLSDLSRDQLKFQFSLVPRIRKVAKVFATNLPLFVQWKDLDRSLDDEGKLIDGLTAGQ